MSNQQEIISSIKVEVREHYMNRGFPPESVAFLLAEFDKGLSAGGETLPTIGGTTFKKKDPLTGKFSIPAPLVVSTLRGRFPTLVHDPRTISTVEEALAIFAFSFGYRLRRKDTGGLSGPPTPSDRLPGQNNRALACICTRLRNRLKIPLFAQFEIADALEDLTETSADHVSSVADLGTKQVVEEFLKKAGQKPEKVVVVAHYHHVGRCCLLLEEEFRIRAIPSIESYEGYDPCEAQERVVCPESFIVSDFVSMAVR